MTEVARFILLGPSSTKSLHVPLSITFALIYLVDVVGNMGTILLVLLDSHLHSPLYFFLRNLSLVDVGYSTAVIPTVLAGFLEGDGVISYNACAAQMFFFAALATMENFLLAAMAYDRYAAVCKPLHYTTTVTTGACARLATGSWIFGILTAAIDVGDTFYLSFCMSNVVHHFFCDIPAVMSLTCSNKDINELIVFLISSFNIFFALLVILISYLLIFITILKLQSGKGYQKALSTCASHLVAVSIFYGTVIFMYLQPSSSHSMDTDKSASVFYTMLIPMLNPVVYSLRNREVKSAFKKVIEKAKYSLGLTF